MAFTYDIDTDRGKVRLALGDTHRKTAIFSDAEIDHFLAEGGDLEQGRLLAIQHAMSIAAMRKDPAMVQALERAWQRFGGDRQPISVVFGGRVPGDDGFAP